MKALAQARVASLASLDLSGYVLKRGSPSCGAVRVPVRSAAGRVARTGRGLFAAELLDRFPLLPVVEESDLGDAEGRSRFLERMFGYRRLQNLFDGAWAVEDVQVFHRRECLLLCSHDARACARVGALVARAARLPRDALARRYRAAYLAALARPTTRARHARVLRRIVELLELPRRSRERFEEDLRWYRRRCMPLAAVLTRLRRHAAPHLAGHSYLERHPAEIALLAGC